MSTRTKVALVGATVLGTWMTHLVTLAQSDAAAFLSENGDGPDGFGAGLMRDKATVHSAGDVSFSPLRIRTLRIPFQGRYIDVAMAGNVEKSTVAVIVAGSVAAARPLMSELAAQGLPVLAYSHAGLGAAVSAESNGGVTMGGLPRLFSRAPSIGQLTVFNAQPNDSVIMKAMRRVALLALHFLIGVGATGDPDPSMSTLLLPARSGGTIPTSDVLAEELAFVLREAKVNRAVLVGVHFDWLATAKAALKNATRIGGLVLVDPWFPSSSIALRSISRDSWIKEGDEPRTFSGPVDDSFRSRIMNDVYVKAVELAGPRATSPPAQAHLGKAHSPLSGALFPILSLPPQALFPPASHLIKTQVPVSSKAGSTAVSVKDGVLNVDLSADALPAVRAFVANSRWFAKSSPPVGVFGGDLLASVHHRSWTRGAALGETGTLRIPKVGTSSTLLNAPVAGANEDFSRAFLRMHALRSRTPEDFLVRRSLGITLSSPYDLNAFIAEAGALARGMSTAASDAEWRASADAAGRTYQPADPSPVAASRESYFAAAALHALRAEDHVYALTCEAFGALHGRLRKGQLLQQSSTYDRSIKGVSGCVKELTSAWAADENIVKGGRGVLPPDVLSLQNITLTLAGAIPLASAAPRADISPPASDSQGSNAPVGAPQSWDATANELLELRAAVLAHAGGAIAARVNPLRLRDSAAVEPHARHLLKDWGWNAETVLGSGGGLKAALTRYASGSTGASRTAMHESVSPAAWHVPLCIIDRYGDSLARGGPISSALFPLSDASPLVRNRLASAMGDHALTLFAGNPDFLTSFLKVAGKSNEHGAPRSLVSVAVETVMMGSRQLVFDAKETGGWRLRMPPSTGLAAWVRANLSTSPNLQAYKDDDSDQSFPVSVIITQQSDEQISERAYLPPHLNFPDFPYVGSEKGTATATFPWSLLDSLGPKGESTGSLSLDASVPAPSLLNRARVLLRNEQIEQARLWASVMPAACIVRLPAESAHDVASTVIETANRALRRGRIQWTESSGWLGTFGLSPDEFTIDSTPRDGCHVAGDLGDAHALTAVGDAVAYGPPQPHRPPLHRVAAEIAAHVRADIVRMSVDPN